MHDRLRRLWERFLEDWLRFWGIETPDDER